MKFEILYKNEETKKYERLAGDFNDRAKAQEWAETYEKVFNSKCKVEKQETNKQSSLKTRI